MFKQSRRKIVAAIMSVLVLLFLGTLAVIYASSYFEVSANNYKMLERHAQLHILTGDMDGEKPKEPQHGGMVPFPEGGPGGKPFEDTPSFRLSTFYSVAVGEDGKILDTDLGDRELYDEETLGKYATQILKSGKKRGIKERLIFLVAQKNGYTLVAFMDNTIMQESMTTLFRHTLVFGSIAMVALFFLAVFLARKIVKPLEEGYLRQKQFISDAGHELKTPVSVVSANAELLSRQIGENQWLSNIQYENQRMGELVRQLLELARTENVSAQMEILDFSRLTAGGVLPFESIAYEKGLCLQTELSDNIMVLGNSSQLSQLVSILMDNAIHHSQDGKQVMVKLIESRDFAVLSVINTGDPIPPEQIKHLFERFYRADEARTGDGQHYGLGLAIAKGIVTAHNGKIEVKCHDGLVEFRVAIPKK